VVIERTARPAIWGCSPDPLPLCGGAGWIAASPWRAPTSKSARPGLPNSDRVAGPGGVQSGRSPPLPGAWGCPPDSPVFGEGRGGVGGSPIPGSGVSPRFLSAFRERRGRLARVKGAAARLWRVWGVPQIPLPLWGGAGRWSSCSIRAAAPGECSNCLEFHTVPADHFVPVRSIELRITSSFRSARSHQGGHV
jgi:hypothetical protein